MSQKSYLAHTRVKWNLAHTQERAHLWTWCEQQFGLHGESWSCDISSDPGESALKDVLRVKIVTLCEQHHMLVMCAWG